MVSFLEAAAAGVRGVQCQLLNANEFVVGSVGRFAGSIRQRALDGINANRRLLGCTGPDIQEPPSPFEGGQCPGTIYECEGTFSYDTFRCSDGGFVNSTPSGTLGNFVGGTFEGPISSVSIENFGTPCRGVPTGVRARIVDRGGARDRTYQIVSVNGTFNRQNLGISPVFIATSGPDDCGDPLPIYPPPVDIDIDIDIDYDDDDGNPINITIPFIFAPITVLFDGSLEIPFSFDFGGFTFDGSFNLNPDIGVTINFPRLPRGEGQGTEVLPPGNEDDEVDPRQGEEKVIGLVVTSTIDSRSGITDVSTSQIPTLWVPRLGSVKFAYSFGGTTFWSRDIDVKGVREFIECPFSQGADFSAASPSPGVTMQFVEIKGFPLATSRDVAGLD